ncbi:MAG: sensor histidine kinase [Elusimicrobiota bacterium]
MNDKDRKKIKDLRKKAKEKVARRDIDFDKITEEEIADILQELDIHQEELRMQNEELRKTQLELEEIWHKYSDLYDFAPIGYFTFDENIGVKNVNLTGADMLGVDRSALIDRPFLPYVKPADRDQFTKDIKAAINKGVKKSSEIELRDKNRSELYVQVESRSYKERGKETFCFSTVMDITEKKKAKKVLARDKETLKKLVEEKTKELDRSKHLAELGKLASAVAHELRNPQGTIKVSMHNLKRKNENPEINPHIHRIEKKLQEESQIIDNLLSYAKLNAPRFEEVDIRKVIRNCLEELREKEGNCSKFFRESITDETLLARIDSIQITQVLYNILNNACDAVDDKEGDIEIRAYKDRNGDIKIICRDNGPGMNKEVAEKITEPFFTTKAKGTGLGMSISKTLIKQHNGSLDINTEKGNGAQIIITLPSA